MFWCRKGMAAKYNSIVGGSRGGRRRGIVSIRLSTVDGATVCLYSAP